MMGLEGVARVSAWALQAGHVFEVAGLLGGALVGQAEPADEGVGVAWSVLGCTLVTFGAGRSLVGWCVVAAYGWAAPLEGMGSHRVELLVLASPGSGMLLALIGG